MDKSKYPVNWNEISQRIRQREGNCCKWCGIPNGSHIHRLKANPFEWILHEEYLEVNFARQHDYTVMSKIVLTVAHLNHDTTDNQDGNLAALCNRCHLTHDARYHADNAKRTRQAKKAQAAQESGQLELWQNRG